MLSAFTPFTLTTPTLQTHRNRLLLIILWHGDGWPLSFSEDGKVKGGQKHTGEVYNILFLIPNCFLVHIFIYLYTHTYLLGTHLVYTHRILIVFEKNIGHEIMASIEDRL
jgi:hypothetical protein